MTKPRVLHLAYEDPRRPGAGGGSLRTYEVNRRIAGEFAVTAVCASYAGAEDWEEGGVNYTHIGLPVGYMTSLLSYFAALPLAVRRGTWDLIVEDFGAPFSTIGIPRLTKTPVVGVVQWLFAREKSEQYHLPFHLVERFGLAQQRTLIAVSDDLSEELRTRAPQAKIVTVANGLEDAAFVERTRSNDSSKRILYLGRLDTAQKGLDILLNAFARTARDMPHDLFLGGEGPNEAELRDMASRLGIADRVHFTGVIPRSSRFDWLAEGDLLAMPSRYETFGMVAAESLAVGTPVVAFDIPCLRNLVTDKVGRRVAPFDVEEYARTMLELANNDMLRVELSANAPETVRGLRWDAVAERQAAVYRQLISSVR